MWLVAIIGLARAETVAPERIYGRTVVGIVRHATECEAQRIAVEHGAPQNGAAMIKVTTIGVPQILSAQNLELLRGALLKKTEEDKASKLCVPSPGVRYLFRAKSDRVSILVCYKCRMIVVEDNGRVVAQADVDEVIVDLKKVAESFLAPEEVAKLP